MGKLVKILIGLVLCLIGVFAIILCWSDVWTLIRGAIGFLLILAGLLFFAVASD